MAVICGVLTPWQKEKASTTCLDSSRTHSQRVEKEEEGLVVWFIFFVLCCCCLFNSVIEDKGWKLSFHFIRAWLSFLYQLYYSKKSCSACPD